MRIAAAQSELGLILVTPEKGSATADAIRLSRQLGKPVYLQDIPAPLAEALRWMPRPQVQEECTARVSQARSLLTGSPAGALPDEHFRQLLTEADRYLLDLNFDATLQRVQAATALIPCLTRPVENAQVRALFLYEAVARFYKKDKLYPNYFQYMLAVDPRLFLETDYAPKVQQAFLAVAKKASRLPPIPLNVLNVEGTLFLDGKSAAGLTEVAPGRHIVQQQGPLGELRSTLVTVPETPPGRVAPLFALSEGLESLPFASQSVQALQDALRARALSLELQEALDRFARSAGKSILGFALPSNGGDAAAVFYAPGRGLFTPTEQELRPLQLSRAATRGPDAETEVPPAPERSGDFQPTSPPEPGLQLSLGLGGRRLLSSETVEVMAPHQLPLTIAATYRLNPLLLRVDADLDMASMVQNIASAPISSGECGSYDADAGDPTGEALAAALSCLEAPPALAVGAGAGVSLPLSDHLSLAPVLMLHAQRLSQVLVRSGDPASWQVHQALTVGPTLSSRLSWQGLSAASHGTAPALHLYLEPAAGLRVASLDGSLLLTVSLSAALGGEVVF